MDHILIQLIIPGAEFLVRANCYIYNHRKNYYPGNIDEYKIKI